MINFFKFKHLDTIETIKAGQEGDATKVVNLIKSIQKNAEENSDDPFLIALTDRAQLVQESFEDRQAEQGMDDLTYFVMSKFDEAGVPDSEATSKRVAGAFAAHPNWQKSENQQRDLRQAITFALYAAAEDPDENEIAAQVEGLLSILRRQA